ncbi:MAG: hypothetical protein N2515_11035, partial [Deltaproteobacteria bacterium]|nr:hypothetical protein [Deltaproteobacteria bacterium]
LVTHAGALDVAGMHLCRSVRLVAHPQLRRIGIASRLVEHCHRTISADLYGTLFGAAADIIAFRHSLGYQITYLGSSRNPRSGQPSVVMLRAGSERARALVQRLRMEFARGLKTRLALLESEDPLPLDPSVRLLLERDLPAVVPWSEEELIARARSYVGSARTFDSDGGALCAFIERFASLLVRLPPSDSELLRSRGIEKRSWAESAHRAGLASAGAARRRMRKAMGLLLNAVEKSWGLDGRSNE